MSLVCGDPEIELDEEYLPPADEEDENCATREIVVEQGMAGRVLESRRSWEGSPKFGVDFHLATIKAELQAGLIKLTLHTEDYLMKTMPKTHANFNNLFRCFLENDMMVPCWLGESLTNFQEFAEGYLTEIKEKALKSSIMTEHLTQWLKEPTCVAESAWRSPLRLLTKLFEARPDSELEVLYRFCQKVKRVSSYLSQKLNENVTLVGRDTSIKSEFFCSLRARPAFGRLEVLVNRMLGRERAVFYGQQHLDGLVSSGRRSRAQLFQEQLNTFKVQSKTLELDSRRLLHELKRDLFN